MTIYNEQLVPILFRGDNEVIGLSSDANDTVVQAHEAYIAAAESGDPEALAEHLLIADSVIVHNADPSIEADWTPFSVGASDIQEAMTEVISAYDVHHTSGDTGADHLFKPEWVASTNPELARLLADYYSAEVREISEVLQ